MVNPIFNIPSMMQTIDETQADYDFRRSVIETANKFDFTLSKDTVTQFSLSETQRVIGIVGIECEDDFALMQDGAFRHDAFFILCDPNTFVIEEGAAHVSSGLSYVNGVFHFVQFSTPKRIDYLVNYYVKPIGGRYLDCPFIIRDEVRNYLFLKHLTSGVLLEAGLLVPREETLVASIIEKDNLKPINRDKNANIENRSLKANSVRYVDIARLGEYALLDGFLEKVGSAEGVIKPNNAGCGEGVFMLNHDNLEAGKDHLNVLLSQKRDVLLQERIMPPLVERQGKFLDWNLRVFVSRDENGGAVAGDMIVRIGEQGGPINLNTGAKIGLLEEIACQLNWTRETYKEVRRLALRTSEEAYTAICQAIRIDSSGVMDNIIPDILGVDLIICYREGIWMAYIIEMDINPGGAWHLNNRLKLIAGQSSDSEYLTPKSLSARVGKANRDWVDLILYRCEQWSEK